MPFYGLWVMEEKNESQRNIFDFTAFTWWILAESEGIINELCPLNLINFCTVLNVVCIRESTNML